MKKILSLTLLLVFSATYAQAKTTLSDEAIQAVKDEIARATKAGEIEGGMILVHIHGEQRLLDIQGYHDLEDQPPFSPMYSAQIRSSRPFRQKQIPSSPVRIFRGSILTADEHLNLYEAP